MWPDRVSNPEPLTYESGALPTALRGPAAKKEGLRDFGGLMSCAITVLRWRFCDVINVVMACDHA